MVQQGQPGRLVGHQPSGVDEEHDLLALRGLELANGELVSPGGRPPIDPLVIVVDRVVAEPFEFVVLADLPRPPHAQQAEPIRAGQERVLVQLLQVGIDVDGRRQRIIQQPLPETETAAGQQEGALDLECAAAAGPQHVAEHRPAAASRSTWNSCGSGRSSCGRPSRSADAARPGGMVHERQRHGMRLCQRGDPPRRALRGKMPSAAAA